MHHSRCDRPHEQPSDPARAAGTYRYEVGVGVLDGGEDGRSDVEPRGVAHRLDYVLLHLGDPGARESLGRLLDRVTGPVPAVVHAQDRDLTAGQPRQVKQRGQGRACVVGPVHAQQDLPGGSCGTHDNHGRQGAVRAISQRVPIFPLGVGNASPLEMAEAYASFAARGLHCDARPVSEVRGPDGAVLSAYPSSCQQVVAPTTADAVNDVLRGVLEPGGFASAAALKKPAAGKTGNNEGLSVWFVGHTPARATAAVIGVVGPEGAPGLLQGSVVGGSVIGVPSASVYAAPLWGDAMRGVEDLLPDADFVYPAAVPGAGATP